MEPESPIDSIDVMMVQEVCLMCGADVSRDPMRVETWDTRRNETAYLTCRRCYWATTFRQREDRAEMKAARGECAE